MFRSLWVSSQYGCTTRTIQTIGCVYALLDNASGGTFIKGDSLQKLGMEGIESSSYSPLCMAPKKLRLKLLMASQFEKNDISVTLPRTYVRQQIPADRDEIPQPERVQEWPHLQQVTRHIPTYMDSVEVGLFIGLNCPGAVRPRDVICRNDNDPYAVPSLLGWYVNSPVRHNSRNQVHCY